MKKEKKAGIKLKPTPWTVGGLNIISSDSIYQKLVECINNDNLEESYLQKITGHKLPILVDRKKHHIQFCNY